MSLHEKVSRRVRRWDADIVVDPGITAAQWRAVMRPSRVRIAAGVGLIVVVAPLVIAQLASGWHLRPLRVLAFAGIVVLLLLIAFVAVTVADARASLPLRHPHLFSVRRSDPGAGALPTRRGPRPLPGVALTRARRRGGPRDAAPRHRQHRPHS